ncbi:uncharacterized protein LOC105828724 [Monomorium pharaonis]|uniref:uncharacterized protein LOC105828724 n=1 Tax=Monomorium pharaonis TaxID=307658 RepID=UPI00063F2F4E|nr:uncharacterized protein LOC105828724 [Monomorium pharaonis]
MSSSEGNDGRESAERRGPVACVGVDVALARARTRTETDVDAATLERGRQGDGARKRRIYGPGMEEGQTCPGCRPGERTAKEETVWKSCGVAEEETAMGEEEEEEEEEEERERHRGNLLCFERYGGGPRNT